MVSPGIPARFVIERELGAGGFGAVYAAYDRERDMHVALKRLVRRGPGALYRFKQEFRALAGVTHPNLVRLHDLFAVGEDWCFTMDLVAGVPFDRHVRAGPAPGDDTGPATDPGSDPTAVDHGTRSDASTVTLESDPRPNLDEARLRAALRELVVGVLALHQAGILHRDIKPSNVLVRPDGRVVILDFGLAATGVVDTHQSLEVLGTPAYMSPEQALGLPLSPASDFYSVGIMLYEALCGHPPFSGTARDMLAARTERDPRDPRSLWRGLPDDLCDLCMTLLRRDPARRPTGADLAARLSLEAEQVAVHAPRAPFVGRAHERELLHQAFADAQAGTPVVVSVRGASGMGKSALVRRFLEEVQEAGPVVVLEGRCYERAYVPYKAFDDIVDALVRHLQRLPEVEAAALLPRNVRAVARLFPSLGRLEVLQAAPGREAALDVHEVRRRAFAALRELLGRLGDRTPVVLFVDDAQWADADSAALVFELLRPPEPPPLLLIVADRGEGEAGTNDVLRILDAARPEGAAHRNLRLDLGPLPAPDAGALARALLAEGARAADRAEAIARESGGSPLFMAELVRAATRTAPGSDLSLQGLLVGRVRGLDDHARVLLGVLACAIRPLPADLLRRAAELGPREGHEALDRLRAGGLVQTALARGKAVVEILHDRLRAAVLESAGEEEHRRLSHCLATTLESIPDTDPEPLARLFAAAGDASRASLYAERAGDRASAALAFDQAATLYLQALDGAGDEGRLGVLVKLADALAQAGRGRDAAFMYVEAARLAEADDGSALRERAAVQLLRSGHVEAGLEVIRPVAEATGLAPPATPGRALASLLWNRARLRVRPQDGTRPPRPPPGPEALRRIDLCWALGNGLVGVDLLRSAGYQARHLRLALEAGEPYRVARALAFEAILSALEGPAGLARSRRLLGRAETLAREVGHPHALAWTVAAAAIQAWAECRLAAAAELCEQAAALFHERCTDIFHEVGSLEVWFNLHVRFLMGRLEDVSLRASTCVREAETRGDLYTLTTARAYVLPTLWLAQGRAEAARREAEAAIAQWGNSAWHHQHWARLRADCHADLYDGDGARLLERVAESRPKMKRALQLRLRTLRIELTYLEGRGALDASLATPGRWGELARVVDRAVAGLRREGSPWASAHALALSAGRAAVADDPRRADAPALFEAAGAAYAALDMPLYAAACAARRGELVGGEEGQTLRAGAEAALRAAGVRREEEFTAFLAPRVRA